MQIHGNQFLNDGVKFYAAGDCGQAGSAWRGWFPTVWGNVGVADKGEGHPLKKRGASCHPCKANELESVNGWETRYRCPPSEKNKTVQKCRKFSV